jgi:hypothetical protein
MEEGVLGDDMAEDFAAIEEEGVEKDERVVIPEPLEVLYKFHPESILDYSDSVAAKIPLRVALGDG